MRAGIVHRIWIVLTIVLNLVTEIIILVRFIIAPFRVQSANIFTGGKVI